MILDGLDVEPGLMVSVVIDFGCGRRRSRGALKVSIELLAEGEMIRLAVEPLLSNVDVLRGSGGRDWR
jgi:hypothetical protein